VDLSSFWALEIVHDGDINSNIKNDILNEKQHAFKTPSLAIVGMLLVAVLKDYKGAKDYAEKALALLKEPNC